MGQQELETPFTRVKRAPNRGSHERQAVYDILDATPLCHFGYIAEGRPVVTPTCHWRDGDELFWHGSRISRALLCAAEGEVCVTVTLLDGLVLARSAFHHSANYRSAMVFGRPKIVESAEAREAALKSFIDGLYPGRWDELRPVTRKEINATTVLSLPINEASAKVRTGPPIDDPDDLDWPVWAGIVPTTITTGSPLQAADQPEDRARLQAITPACFLKG